MIKPPDEVRKARIEYLWKRIEQGLITYGKMYVNGVYDPDLYELIRTQGDKLKVLGYTIQSNIDEYTIHLPDSSLEEAFNTMIGEKNEKTRKP